MRAALGLTFVLGIACSSGDHAAGSGGASSSSGGGVAANGGASSSSGGNGSGSGGLDASLPDGATPVTPTLPVIPVGTDAYLHWDQLPRLRIGTRTYMRSTYDRAGGNEGADASHFLRQETPAFNVALDVAGPGLLAFVRTNHWHGSPWHYVVDGTDHVVKESSTADPTRPVAGSVFLPEAVFPNPLTWTWSITKGADLNWVPMPFERTFTLAYERTHYGTGYYIYQAFAEGAENLSRPITSFAAKPPEPAVLDLLGRAGEDIAPAGSSSEGTKDVARAERTVLATLDGSGTVRRLALRIGKDQATALSGARLVVTWDGRAQPSIDAPVPLFFGAGSLHNRANKDYLVRALLESVRFDGDAVELASYFPMPYFRGAKVELVADAALTGLSWDVRVQRRSTPESGVGNFHATYRDHGAPERGKDLVLLDTTKVEGGGDFCGTFVGTSFVFSDRADLTTLEGDPRFFFDDSDSPQAYGTGTEEWAGGGDYWGGENMTLPLAGHPVGAPNTLVAQNDEDRIESAYRLLVADAFPFGKNARIQLEHGGLNDSTEHYRSVTYWYGLPGACLVRTDALDVGNAADEAAHRYTSPAASEPETVASRHELGVDHLGLDEIFPETTEDGRHTTGTTEFTAKLAPDNVGALLRRKLDYGYANQRAEVWVADDRDGAPFVRAGTWYLAGSNTCVYSNPFGELDLAQSVVQTSNRRFRDDEFLVPRSLTEGRSAVRFRLVFTKVETPLTPGAAPPTELAWSELRYSVYSWRAPPAP